MMYARSTMSSVCSTLWSVMMTPMVPVLQRVHDLLNIVDRDRVDPREGFIQKHELRLSNECSRDLETPSLPAG